MYDIINSSFIAGIAQTIIGHPFDTIKTYKQIEYKKSSMKIMQNLVKKNTIFYLYRGFIPPLIGGCFQNCLMFSSEHYINNLVNNNSLLSGFIAGSVTSLLISPAELVKSKLQINKNELTKNIIMNNNLFRGLFLTILRDSLGFSIYFGTYNFLQNYNDNPFINGGISGVFSWIYSYPIDVLKTKYTIYDKTLYSILKNQNKQKILSGMNIMLVRAFFVNAGIFCIFEKIKKNFPN